MKTFQKFRERFYWSKSKEDVEKSCPTCDDCAARNGPNKVAEDDFTGTTFRADSIGHLGFSTLVLK